MVCLVSRPTTAEAARHKRTPRPLAENLLTNHFLAAYVRRKILYKIRFITLQKPNASESVKLLPLHRARLAFAPLKKAELSDKQAVQAGAVTDLRISSTRPSAVVPEKRAWGSITRRWPITGTAISWMCSGVTNS